MENGNVKCKDVVEELERLAYKGFEIAVERFDDTVLYRVSRPPYNSIKKYVELY